MFSHNNFEWYSHDILRRFWMTWPSLLDMESLFHAKTIFKFLLFLRIFLFHLYSTAVSQNNCAKTQHANLVGFLFWITGSRNIALSKNTKVKIWQRSLPSLVRVPGRFLESYLLVFLVPIEMYIHLQQEVSKH